MLAFTPLPPAAPLPSAPPLPNVALRRGAFLQLWGHSQFVGLTDAEVPPALKEQYGFDLVIAVPREAHNSMCDTEAHGQQCTRADQLTEAQFNAGVAGWAAVNVSLVLYTSIMHIGHSPAWENGTYATEHPEWSERDEHGACPKQYGQCNISPAGGGVDAAINYTKGLLALHPSLNSVMIDNAFWQYTGGGTLGPKMPAGFENVARAAFREYVTERFGASAREFIGVDAADAAPPNASQRDEAAPSPLFGVWKVWRARAYAAAVERFRAPLHVAGVSLLANTAWWPLRWELGCDEVLGHGP